MVSAVEKDTEALKRDLGKFREDLGKALADVGEYSHEKVLETRERLRQAATDFGNVAEERIGRARQVIRHQGERAITASRETVKKKPVTALAAAFAAGLLSAMLLGRHRR
jgi:ElaB/YqjD/DUF883 family membrane-anchored ribosome-binding protein